MTYHNQPYHYPAPTTKRGGVIAGLILTLLGVAAVIITAFLPVSNVNDSGPKLSTAYEYFQLNWALYTIYALGALAAVAAVVAAILAAGSARVSLGIVTLVTGLGTAVLVALSMFVLSTDGYTIFGALTERTAREYANLWVLILHLVGAALVALGSIIVFASSLAKPAHAGGPQYHYANQSYQPYQQQGGYYN